MIGNKRLRLSAFFTLLLCVTSCGEGDDNPQTINPPIVHTNEISSISFHTAEGGGHISIDVGTVLTSQGICWKTSSAPTIADDKTEEGVNGGSFVSTMTGLTEGKMYHVRAYATYSEGTVYGNEVTFTTLTGETITDIDNNVYHTTTIGTQLWMAENLKVTRYNDDTPITLITDNTQWSSATTPAYCWFNNDAATHKDLYGALYNWYVVDSDKLCPTGWHVPTDAEWTTLVNYLGGEGVAAHKLKESGTLHWVSSNTATTNESNFTALPGGTRYSDGTFYERIGETAFFWSSTEDPPNNALHRFILHIDGAIGWGSTDKEVGMSVRCLAD